MPLRNAPTTNPNKESRFHAALFVQICLCLTLAFAGCSRADKYVCYEDAQAEWREGDLVLRGGNSLSSYAVMHRSRSVYSHIGLLHYDSLQGEWQVVHAVPKEEEIFFLKTEPVSVFFSPERAQCGGWLRINCSDSIARLAARYALGKVAEHVRFDSEYLLADTTRIYCSELVWLAYGHHGIDVSGGRRRAVPELISKEGECIFPEDIQQSATTLFYKSLKTKVL